MNLRFYIICTAAVIALVGPALANSTATVHGAVYGWDTFEPLENAVVEVNSTPSQSMVAKYGLYSFDLVPGDYTITARYYQNSTLIYSAEKTVKVKDEGRYVFDLLLLPVYSEELMDDSGVNGFSKNSSASAENLSSNTTNPLTSAVTGQIASSSKDNSSSMDPADPSSVAPLSMSYLLVAFLLLFLFGAGYGFSRRGNKLEESRSRKSGHIPRAVHTTGELSEPFEVPELSAETPDKRVETFHRRAEQSIEVPHEIEPEMKQEPRRKLPETKFAEERAADEAKEPVRELIKSPVKESMPEIPKKERQVEPSEIKEKSLTNRGELAGSEPGKEKQEAPIEEVSDKPVRNSEVEIPASRKKLPLPSDLQEVMDIIRGQGGRITQKDLRSKLRYSEGKVSLMLADLERRELIEKFKRGRGNVVILRDEER